MLNSFRTLFKSKIGALVAIVFLVLIALAFAGGDVAGLRTSGVSSNGNDVAEVGKEGVDAALLVQSANSALDRVKQQQPNMTMKDLLRQGALKEILQQLIDRTAVSVFGKDHGIVAGNRLIDSEIAQMPAFQGADGKFDEKTYRAAIAQRGLSEKLLRDDIAQGLISRQLFVPIQFGTVMPKGMARQYAEMLDEKRTGSVAVLPSLLFAPEKPPTDQELAEFYKGHTSDFIRPERRTIRYAMFTDAALKSVPAVTDAEIAKRYDANKAQYAAQDKRKITQLIVPTEAAAKAIIAEVQGGKSLETAAKEKGLTAAPLEYFSREDLTNQFSKDVADAVFATSKGKLATPEKSPLGWHVIRVDDLQQTPARSLADVTPDLRKEIAEEKRRAALTDLFASIEDKLASGASIAEVAKGLDATVQTTQPLTADGNVYGKPGESAPAEIKPLLATAFTMSEQQPQVAEVERGKSFAVYDVAKIQPSAPAPLAEIKDDVKLDYALTKGSAAAKAAAIKIAAEVRRGQSLDAAVKALGKKLPPIEQVGMTRPQLTAARQAGKQVPPPVTLMFSMAKGSVKVQSAAKDRGWFVVQLKDVETPDLAKDAPVIDSAARELGSASADEYVAAMRSAVTRDIPVKRNDKVIAAVAEQLGGTASGNDN